MRWACFIPLVVTACTDPGLVESPLVRSTEWVAGALCEPAPEQVDVLLVIDDSPSMAAHAERLMENLRLIGEVYAASALDYRIGVTTPRGPGFLDTPCTQSSPWLSRNEDTPDALACLGQVGASDDEAPLLLSGALRALETAEDPSDPVYGFLRPGAGLSIVFIADEDDHSSDQDVGRLRSWLASTEADKQSVRGTQGQRVFVSAVTNPDEAERTVAFVSGFDPWMDAVVPISDDVWLGALACLPGGDPLPPLCLDVSPLALTEDASQACVVLERRDGETRRLPACIDGAPPVDADACATVRTHEQVDESCLDRGLRAQAVVVRRDPEAAQRCVEVKCATTF